MAELWNLNSLISGRPGLTPAEAASLMEAAAVCFDVNQQTSPVPITLTGEFAGTPALAFPEPTSQTRRTHADLPRAVERGACAVAALVCERQLGLSIVEQSRRGKGFDYWLGHNDDALFQWKARLEVSGILKGNTGQVQKRLREKLNRLTGDSPWSTWVVVVEFSQPGAHTVRR